MNLMKQTFYGLCLVILLPTIFLFMLLIKLFLLIPETVVDFLEIVDNAFTKAKDGDVNTNKKNL